MVILVESDPPASLCRELKRDLHEAITEMLKDLREAGTSAEFMPSRSDLNRELGSALQANGSSDF